MPDDSERSMYSGENPYASPRPGSQSVEPLNTIPLANGSATAKIHYTSDYLIQALKRFRLQQPGGMRLPFRILLVILCTGAAAVAFWQRQYVFASVLLVFAILLTIQTGLGNRITKRAFSSSPFFNEEITIHLSDAGFHSISEIQDSRLRWAIFQKIVYFDDGYLLFQGPAMFNWLPLSAFLDGTDFHELESLLRSKIPQHVERRRRKSW